MNSPNDRQWQPIETAPKDGRAILIHCGQTPRPKVWSHNTYVAEWWDSEGEEGAWMCCMGGGMPCPVAPTHWLPLPEPPKADASAPTDDEAMSMELHRAAMEIKFLVRKLNLAYNRLDDAQAAIEERRVQLDQKG